jgi:hypothetical protein
VSPQLREPRAERARSWVEFELEGPWTVTLGFVNHGEELVLADVRIFPTRHTPGERGLNPRDRNSKKGRDWGDWSWDPDIVPAGGLTARKLRTLRLGDAMKVALANLLSSGHPADAGFVTARRLVRLRPANDDRRRRSPELLARVALVYEHACAAGEHPNDKIHDNLTGSDPWWFDRSTVPSLVRAARAAGYLTPATKGRASGRATAAAHALVNER